MPPLLALEAIDKRFGRSQALAQASLAVWTGTIHVLFGENGAGKTTLMRVAFGLLRPDRGVVRVDGQVRTLRSPADAIAFGIGMVHQHFSLVPALTVAENVALAQPGGGRFDPARAAGLVRDTARRAGLAATPDVRVANLDVAAQQRIEVLKALATGARLLILDEPTAVLAPSEVDELLAWLRRFRDAGGSVVLITHKLREALAVADDITVLRQGRVALATERRVTDEARVVDALLGAPDGGNSPLRDDRDANRGSVRVPRSPGATRVVAEVRGVSACDTRGILRLREATLCVRAGEIVGVAAVEGAGHRELLRVLAGRLRAVAGEVRLPEGIGFIPEDRQRDALILEFSLAENVALRGAGTRRGRMRWCDWTTRARAQVTAFDVRAPDVTAPVATLSGGNQQKLVLARELAGHPTLVVAENPTRGLDLRATAAVFAALRAARDAGAAVVYHSTDLDEVLALADRVVVAFAGHLRDVAKDRERVGRAMLGAA